MPDMVTLTIDGREIVVPPGTKIIEAAGSVGIEIPRFCYHPKLTPVAVCRCCLVEVEKVPKLIPACATPVSAGMVVRTRATSEKVRKAQQGMIEFLLINHPLDCPVCDKGGECPLQDQTLAYGPGGTRFSEKKHHFKKPVSLGPHVLIDRERCILCLRCVQFQREIARHPQISVTYRGRDSFIDTAPGRTLDSNFSGNTVEICPVGALTGKHYRFRARPWEYERKPSVCPECACGCNVYTHVRNGEVLRIASRENPLVDDGWLCDRGRFSVRPDEPAPPRLTTPLVRINGKLMPVSWDGALEFAASAFREIAQAPGRPEGVVGAVAGPAATNEELYLLARILRTSYSSNNLSFDGGGSAALRAAGFAPVGAPDIAWADTILLIASDPSRDLPILDLRIKKAVRNGARLAVLGDTSIELASLAAAAIQAGSADLSRAVEEIAKNVPAQTGPGAFFSAGRRIVVALGEEASRDKTAVSEVGKLIAALSKDGREVRAGVFVGGTNAAGAIEMGFHPDYLPGLRQIDDVKARAQVEAVWSAGIAAKTGLAGSSLLRAAASGEVKGLYVMGADPAARNLTPEEREGLGKLDCLVVTTDRMTKTAESAHVVLPAAAFWEKAGSLTNVASRVQRFEAVVPPPAGVMSDVEILAVLAKAGCLPLPKESFADPADEIARLSEPYARSFSGRKGSPAMSGREG
ncbi:MAG: NADH-quinone oxidoreductase subunit NuoG [Nitrospirae bacterium]|nr:NADH-quinone oxidoreductase subunit NuoG [Nitrospirota bacterium]